MIDNNAKPVFRAFLFSNTTEGANSLLDKLSKFEFSEIEVGMEATGHYWFSIYSFLVDKGFVVHIVNPIQTDGWRKGTEIRKRKTDIIDSVLIADLIRYGDLSADDIAQLYKIRWNIETFFRVLKQNFTIKKLFGKSKNASFSQGIIAFICYLFLHHIYNSLPFAKLKISIAKFSFLHFVRAIIFFLSSFPCSLSQLCY